MRPGDPPVHEFEADELPADPLLVLPDQDVASEELVLLEFNDPFEVRLQRGRRVVDVVPIERELGLEPERVAGAQADRLEAMRFARLDNGVPYGAGLMVESVDLEPVLARVARPGNQTFFSGHLAEGAGEGFHRRQDDVGQGLEDRDRFAALEGELAVAVRGVIQADLEGALLGDDIGVVLVGVRGVDDEEIKLRMEAIDQHIVHVGALGRHQGRILDHAGRKTGDVVRRNVLDEGQSVLAGDVDLAHVADVEQPRRRPAGDVLVDDALVFDGHVPADKLYHLGPEFAVVGVEACLFHMMASFVDEDMR